MPKFMLIIKIISYLVLIGLLILFIYTLIINNAAFKSLKQIHPILMMAYAYFMIAGAVIRSIKAKPIADEILALETKKASAPVMMGLIFTAIFAIILLWIH